MKFALIGCGAQGLDYARAAKDSGLDLAVCADTRLAAAKKAAAITRARAATDCTRIIDLKEIAAVILAVPPDQAEPYITRAAKARKPILVASPLLPAAQKAVAAARSAKSLLYLAHASRVAPEMNAVAAQLAQRAIGQPGFARIVRVGLAPDAKHVAGALEVLFASDAAWLVAQFGAKARVFAQKTAAPKLDSAAVTLTFADGPIVQWVGTCSALASAPRASIEVCGSAGLVQYSSDDPILETDDGRAVRRASPLAQSAAARHLAQFLRALKDPSAAPAPDHDIAALRLLDAALQSAASGREVRA
jgi:predicted dehydrogenase